MPHSLIIGGGVGGLYLALRLIKKGILPENIVIIEHRPLGIYTRPGHFNTSLFNIVSRDTQIPVELLKSDANHIKDLERGMYKRLKELNIQFIQAKFIGLQARTPSQDAGVIIKTNQGIQFLEADYVFDCSGIKGEVIDAVNQYQQTINAEPAFRRTQLTDINPITDHLVAQVIIPEGKLYDLGNYYDVLPDFLRGLPQKSIHYRERLIQLGWSYEAFPYFYSFQQKDSPKTCLYMETPKDFPADRYHAWIRLMLEIYSKGAITNYQPLKESRKGHYKPRIVGFRSEPHVLNKAVHSSPVLPVVIAVFDVLKGFEYREAHGMISGIQYCKIMLSKMKISNGAIEDLNIPVMEDEIFVLIHGSHKKQISTVLNGRQVAIDNALIYFSQIYAQVADFSPFALPTKQKYRTTAADLAYKASSTPFLKLNNHSLLLGTRISIINECLSLAILANDIGSLCGYLNLDAVNDHIQHSL